jgi:hypothetical protein
MPRTPDKIEPDDIKDALTRSGYLLEYTSETLLRERKYWVQANAAYPDPDTGKLRELDLRAVKTAQYDPGYGHFVSCEIVMECVNNPQPLAFMTRKTEERILYRDDVKVSGYPVKIESEMVPGEWESLQSCVGMQDYHHYCHGRVATQFCCFRWVKEHKRWIALHEDSHFDSFRKLCQATDYFVDQYYKSLTFTGDDPVNIRIYYPVLVVKGELLDVRPGQDPLNPEKKHHLQYRIVASLAGEERVHQIDVVDELAFPDYLDLVERELSETAQRLQEQPSAVRASLDKIVAQVRALPPVNDSKRIRDVLTL